MQIVHDVCTNLVSSFADYEITFDFPVQLSYRHIGEEDPADQMSRRATRWCYVEEDPGTVIRPAELTQG